MTRRHVEGKRGLVQRYPSSTVWVIATFVVAAANLVFDVVVH